MTIPRTIIIKGAGDLASGVAHRLWWAGFDVIMTELAQPLVVRREAAFAAAVFRGECTVEGITARLCLPDQVARVLAGREIPVVVDPDGELVRHLNPKILIDAVMAKRNTGSGITDAALVIGLGPGFVAGLDVHAVIETSRGHNLGRVFYRGAAEADSGIPGEVGGAGRERLLRAPAGGTFKPVKEIGAVVHKGDTVAYVDRIPVTAGVDGLLRGLLFPGLIVQAGMKVGDIDPRGSAVDYRTVSDKARSIGGGVLEAILNRFFRE
ncbi:MAG: selenium-dependent molybdenum cofactor biosynthesis protein YqeB [Bacillota bacterium]